MFCLDKNFHQTANSARSDNRYDYFWQQIKVPMDLMIKDPNIKNPIESQAQSIEYSRLFYLCGMQAEASDEFYECYTGSLVYSTHVLDYE